MISTFAVPPGVCGYGRLRERERFFLDTLGSTGMPRHRDVCSRVGAKLTERVRESIAIAKLTARWRPHFPSSRIKTQAWPHSDWSHREAGFASRADYDDLAERYDKDDFSRPATTPDRSVGTHSRIGDLAEPPDSTRMGPEHHTTRLQTPNR